MRPIFHRPTEKACRDKAILARDARGDATLTHGRPLNRFPRRHLGIPDPQALHVLHADVFRKNDRPVCGQCLCPHPNCVSRVRHAPNGFALVNALGVTVEAATGLGLHKAGRGGLVCEVSPGRWPSRGQPPKRLCVPGPAVPSSAVEIHRRTRTLCPVAFRLD